MAALQQNWQSRPASRGVRRSNSAIRLADILPTDPVINAASAAHSTICEDAANQPSRMHYPSSPECTAHHLQNALCSISKTRCTLSPKHTTHYPRNALHIISEMHCGSLLKCTILDLLLASRCALDTIRDRRRPIWITRPAQALLPPRRGTQSRRAGAEESSDRLTMPGYRPRLAEADVAAALDSIGAVLIDGARACGKTWTARRFARSESRLDDLTVRLLAEVSPDAVLAGPAPRLLDEWQYVPTLWNRVRRECDDRARPGQFILTGSAMPTDSINRHSGMGRIARVRMRPMSLYEMGHSSGEVSLRALFAGETAAVMPSADAASLPGVVSLICAGGWPANLDKTAPKASRRIGAYIAEAARVEVSEAVGVRHRPEALLRLMRSVARNTATEASITRLAADVGGETPLARGTATAYLQALERIFIVEPQPAWSVELRSRATLRRAPKIHFTDPSLAVSSLRATPRRLLTDPETLGLLFESLTVRDLRIYSQTDSGSVYHYRDNTGLEADAIVERDDGTWIAVEVKLNPSPQSVDKAAASLLRLRHKIAPRRLSELAALLVVTSTGAAYRRSDGVQVAPITALGP